VHFVDGSAFSLYGRPNTDPSIPLEKAMSGQWDLHRAKWDGKSRKSMGFVVKKWMKKPTGWWFGTMEFYLFFPIYWE